MKSKSAPPSASIGKKILKALSFDDVFSAAMTFALSFVAIKAIPALFHANEIPLLRDLVIDVNTEKAADLAETANRFISAQTIDRAWNFSAMDLWMLIGPLLILLVLSKFTANYIFNDFGPDDQKASPAAVAYALIADGLSHIVERYLIIIPIIVVFFPTLLGAIA